MTWISCYDRLPEHKQQVIFRTDHEGVWVGRFFKNFLAIKSFTGSFMALTESYGTIGWNHRNTREHSEVHEWMPLPE